MSKRASWVVVFASSMLAYALVASLGQSVWTLAALIPPLVGAFSSFAYLYGRGSGLPEIENEARRPNR